MTVFIVVSFGLVLCVVLFHTLPSGGRGAERAVNTLLEELTENTDDNPQKLTSVPLQLHHVALLDPSPPQQALCVNNVHVGIHTLPECMLGLLSVHGEK